MFFLQKTRNQIFAPGFHATAPCGGTKHLGLGVFLRSSCLSLPPLNLSQCQAKKVDERAGQFSQAGSSKRQGLEALGPGCATELLCDIMPGLALSGLQFPSFLGV